MTDAASLYPSMSQPAAATEAAPPRAAPAPAAPHYMQDIAEPEPVTHQATTAEEKAAALYPEPEAVDIPIPDNIAELRKADDLRGMYDPAKTFGDVINERAFGWENDSVPPAQRAAVLTELANMAADLGMSHSDVRTLRTVGDVCNANPPSDETRLQWREEAVQRLNETYGKDAHQAYRDAVRFAQRDPRVVKILNEGGRGDHPDAVLMLARLARQARMQGKLK